VAAHVALRLGGAWIEREAAVADDDGCDALGDLFQPLGFAQANQVVVAMGIDESGGKVLAICFDDLGIFVGQAFANGVNPAVCYSDVSRICRCAGTVDYQGICGSSGPSMRRLSFQNYSLGGG